MIDDGESCDFFFFNKFILFIYFWLRWVFVAVCRLPLVVVHGLLIAVASLVVSTGSRHVGFSSCASWALECRLSSCGTRA